MRNFRHRFWCLFFSHHFVDHGKRGRLCENRFTRVTISNLSLPVHSSPVALRFPGQSAASPIPRSTKVLVEPRALGVQHFNVFKQGFDKVLRFGLIVIVVVRGVATWK